MTPQRWGRMKEVFGAAFEKPEPERAAFLDCACGGDAALRAEVERLLAESDATSLPSPASGFLNAAAELAPGDTVVHYRIEARLGEGGMGVVYKAKDTRLGRSIALKFIKAQFGRQWEREARAVAALNHPHIATLHEAGDHEGWRYLAMEFVDGRPLKGPLPVKQAIEYGIQMADALAAAHAAGIVHRDLKPANILVTEKGSVKVLDFGLAKREQADAPVSTQTAGLAGTPGYMAPEQLEGKPAGTRSDIFAFGCILYELLSGRPAFPGETMTAALTAVATTEPKPLDGVPERLDELLRLCLRKDPERRLQHIDDARILLEALRDGRGPGETGTSGRSPAASTVNEPLAARGGKLRRMATPILLAALLAAGGFYYRAHQTKPLTDKDSIVLSDFTNTTGDSVFDDTLKQGLSVQLEQSPFLSLLSERRVNDTLKLMGRPAGDRLTPEVTREVCQRTSTKAMLAGSIAELGSQYVIGLKAVNCATGDVLAETQEQAAGKEAVLKALDAAAVRLRRKLGESLSSVQKYATPVEEATTPSLEALKAYSLGVKTDFARGGTPALPLFQRALDLDPSFAMAYARVSAIYVNRAGLEAKNARKAYVLREKVSEWERFFIEGLYYLSATGELEKAAQTTDLWQQSYPRDNFTYLARGAVSGVLGNWEKALEDHREALRLGPNIAFNYANLGNDYVALNRLDEAQALYKQAEERRLEGEILLWNRYLLAFLKGGTVQLVELVSSAMGKPGTEDLLLGAQADTEGWYGKLKNARELTGRAMDSARRNDAKESAAVYQAAAALREVESGNREQARAEANAALKLAPNRDVRAMAALALARAGDTAGAEKLAAELDKTFPRDTLVQRYWLPTIRAAVALARADPNRAIELLKAASTIELSAPTNLDIYLCPVHVRGEACLMLHDGNRAAAEFQKFIDHRGLVGNFPWGALARLGLARAYSLQGDTAKARAAYGDFLTLWKDADPDVPILKEARAEYAKLQ